MHVSFLLFLVVHLLASEFSMGGLHVFPAPNIVSVARSAYCLMDVSEKSVFLGCCPCQWHHSMSPSSFCYACTRTGDWHGNVILSLWENVGKCTLLTPVFGYFELQSSFQKFSCRQTAGKWRGVNCSLL